ncbi:GFA family protein [Amylibacter sp. SFDW26]|uniref:GFA family protein n=1 Tax=Amylibacter sp. SFDW26 TaxID=2652722 RepID=UPI0012626483|nr:GFA family protein [Amylibacter sp. SFDW26]KAB7614488.1 GFA family protein [Amylibacter sp. SFDW26]
MQQEGGCYCGKLRYKISERPIFKALCYCRACQHISGGGPQYFMLVPTSGFRWANGEPNTFKRQDKEDAVTRSFCSHCGTHVVTHRPGLDGVIVKIGTLDNPESFDEPKAAIFVEEKQPFHVIPETLPQFKTLPESS